MDQITVAIFVMCTVTMVTGRTLDLKFPVSSPDETCLTNHHCLDSSMIQSIYRNTTYCCSLGKVAAIKVCWKDMWNRDHGPINDVMEMSSPRELPPWMTSDNDDNKVKTRNDIEGDQSGVDEHGLSANENNRVDSKKISDDDVSDGTPLEKSEKPSNHSGNRKKQNLRIGDLGLKQNNLLRYEAKKDERKDKGGFEKKFRKMSKRNLLLPGKAEQAADNIKEWFNALPKIDLKFPVKKGLSFVQNELYNAFHYFSKSSSSKDSVKSGSEEIRTDPTQRADDDEAYIDIDLFDDHFNVLYPTPRFSVKHEKERTSKIADKKQSTEKEIEKMKTDDTLARIQKQALEADFKTDQRKKHQNSPITEIEIEENDLNNLWNRGSVSEVIRNIETTSLPRLFPTQENGPTVTCKCIPQPDSLNKPGGFLENLLKFMNQIFKNPDLAYDESAPVTE